MTRREATILALVGFGVWLSGAGMFKFGGKFLFEMLPKIHAENPNILVIAGNPSQKFSNADERGGGLM